MSIFENKTLLITAITVNFCNAVLSAYLSLYNFILKRKKIN